MISSEPRVKILKSAVLVLRVSVVFCGAVLFIDFVHVIFTRMVLCFLFRF